MLSATFRPLLALVGGVFFSLGTLSAQSQDKPQDEQPGSALPTFQVKPLPYAEDALSPAISARTVALHYGKHLKGYASKLNALVLEKKISDRNLVHLVSYAAGSVFDNAGQLLNHTLYFDQFKPYQAGAVDEPQGELRKALLAHFRTFEDFQKAFEKAGTEIFGSGWLWLSTNAEGHLFIERDQNAGSPVARGRIPLIAIDVWEHAYYLDYENRRADHLKEIWHILNWRVIEQRYADRQEGVKL